MIRLPFDWPPMEAAEGGSDELLALGADENPVSRVLDVLGPV